MIPVFDPTTQRYVWIPAHEGMSFLVEGSDIESEGGIGVRRRRLQNRRIVDGASKKYSDSIVDYGRTHSPPGSKVSETKV